MRILNLVYLCIALSSLYACDKSEDLPVDEGHPYGPDGLVAQDGEWHLKSIQPFGPLQVYEIGDYVWNIESIEETLDVTETDEHESSVFFPEGSYTITFSTDSLFVDSLGYGFYIEEGNLFVTDHPELDGPIYKFIRQE